MKRRAPESLRSARWFASDDFRSSGHRSRMMQMGYGPEDWEGRPIIAAVNTYSDINACHAHFRHRLEDIRRGVQQAGGLLLEVSAISLADNFIKPSAMLYRNLLSMEVEEQLRALPFDGAVLMGGCDKTTPGLILGAISAELPFVFMPAGPMLRGNFRGKTIGSGSDAFKYWDERRAGNVGENTWRDVEGGIARSYGHCMTMGTASTMTAIAEALGLTMPGASSVPAPDSNHIRMAAACGRRVVDMVWEDQRPADVLTPSAFENALTVAMALGCSTNAIIHLIAMARRAGLSLGLDDFDRKSRTTPVLANVKPSGSSEYLMEDFYYAGGLRALMRQLGDQLDTAAPTVAGTTLGEAIAGVEVHDDDVIRPLSNPVYPEGSLAVLKGNLAPDGAVIKPAAMSQHLLTHEGPALVFDDYDALKALIDDDAAEVTAEHVLILRGVGPQGGPGMPEWGMIPMPRKLLREGVRDMVRISDARMSGTSYGACVLHVAPEAHAGGNLALVRTGDIVRLDVPERRLDIVISAAELDARRQAWVAPPPKVGRGWQAMYARHVGQADTGCDFDYLLTGSGASAPEPEIH